MTQEIPAQEIAASALPPLGVGPLEGDLRTVLSRFNANVGFASGQGLNSLLDTVVQLARNVRRQEGQETPQTQRLQQQALSLQHSLVRVGAVDLHGEIDFYGAEGVGALLAHNFGVRIQAIKMDANGRLTAHPVLGEAGRLVHILHTPGHFQPLWPR